MKPIKIYFTDLKPSKQRELLPRLREFFDGKIPSPLVEFDAEVELIADYDIAKLRKEIEQNIALLDRLEGMSCLDPHERREQDAQIASENQEDEPEGEDGDELDF